MRKNIIAFALNKINAKVIKAEKLLELASGKEVIKNASQNLYEALCLRQVMDDILEAKPLSIGRFMWELEGGDALCTSKLIASAMWTAYSSVFSRWCEDNEIFGDKGMPPVELMELLQSHKATGLDIMNDSAGDGEDTTLTLEERLEFAKAVFIYGMHIAHYKGNEFRWLISMDIEDERGETRTRKTLQMLREWAEERRQEAVSKRTAEAYRMFIEDGICDEFAETLPHIDQAAATVKLWLHSPCDDGTYTSRHERIVSRVSDRLYDNLMDSVLGGDLRDVAKAAKPWELILASPKFHQDFGSFTTSREYKLLVLDRKVKQLEELEAKKAEDARLDAMEAAINARLAQLMGTAPAPTEAPTEEPTEVPAAPEPKVTQLPYIEPHGTRRYQLNVAGPRG